MGCVDKIGDQALMEDLNVGLTGNVTVVGILLGEIEIKGLMWAVGDSRNFFRCPYMLFHKGGLLGCWPQHGSSLAFSLQAS